MNISLPDTLKSFVDEQVSLRGFDTSSEYIRELIRHDRERQQLHDLLVAGLVSEPANLADANYFAELRQRVNNRLTAGQMG